MAEPISEDGELHGDAISAMWIIDSVADAGPLSPPDTPEEA